MGATRNEMLIWKGKDNKQLTTELSIRRRLDKYLRRALILEGRAGKHGLRAIEITACWLGLAPPTYSAHSKKRPRCTLALGTLEIVLLFYLLFFVVECYVNMNVFVGNSRFLREFTEAMVLNFCSTFKNNRQRDETDIWLIVWAVGCAMMTSLLWNSRGRMFGNYFVTTLYINTLATSKYG